MNVCLISLNPGKAHNARVQCYLCFSAAMESPKKRLQRKKGRRQAAEQTYLKKNKNSQTLFFSVEKNQLLISHVIGHKHIPLALVDSSLTYGSFTKKKVDLIPYGIQKLCEA